MFKRSISLFLTCLMLTVFVSVLQSYGDEVTFIFLADPQLNGAEPETRVDRLSKLNGVLNNIDARSLIWPPGFKLTCEGEPIDRPAAIFFGGDLCQGGGDYDDWDQFVHIPPNYTGGWELQMVQALFRKDYEEGSETKDVDKTKTDYERVYFGLGNHDLETRKAHPRFGWWTGFPLLNIGCGYTGFSKPNDYWRYQMWNFISQMHAGPYNVKELTLRNLEIVDEFQTPTPFPVDSIDAPYQGGYSEKCFDWKSYSFNYRVNLGPVEVFQLHIFGGFVKLSEDDDERADGLKWLKDELIKVGTSKPIIIVQHYPFSEGWWNDTQKDELKDILEDYNVIAILGGHIHSPHDDDRGDYVHKVISASASGSGRVFPNFRLGAAHNGVFALLRVTDNTFDIAIGEEQNGGITWLQGYGKPKAVPGGPYVANEGSPIRFDGSGSYGSIDYYEWDMDNDGIFDKFGTQPDWKWYDDYSGEVALQVKKTFLDARMNKSGIRYWYIVDEDYASIEVRNVAPTVDAGLDETIDEGYTFTRSGSFEDPGADTWEATVDYGDGTGEQDLTLDETFLFSTGLGYKGALDSKNIPEALRQEFVGNDILLCEHATVWVVEEGWKWLIESGEECTVKKLIRIMRVRDELNIYADETKKKFSLQHVYADNDTYTVTVTVEDDDKGKGSDAFQVTVGNVAPTVEAGVDRTVNEGATLSLVPAEFNDRGTLDTHTATIDWGDGSPVENGTVTESPFGPPGSTAGADGTTAFGTHEYGDNGTYTVTVTVTDDDGGVGSDTLTVTVKNVAPTATIDSLSSPVEDCIVPGQVVSFAGSFTDPGWLDTHTALWDFGDKNTDPGNLDEENAPPDATGKVSVTHIYTTPGTFTVLLKIQDDDGGIGTDQMEVKVMDASEAVDFVNSFIQDLPDSSFNKPVQQRKNAFSLKLEAVKNAIAAADIEEVITVPQDDTQEKVSSGVLEGAIKNLQKDIRAKGDGYVDGNLKNDWITDEESQKKLCLMIDELVKYLRALQEEENRHKVAGSDNQEEEAAKAAPALPRRLEFATFAAYPQPCNPEVWIPYTLGERAKVSITIHDVNGRAVRILDLGYQNPGAHITRDKAVHWDGKGESGESVASGIYFYTITAGDFSATRKIVVRK